MADVVNITPSALEHARVNGITDIGNILGSGKKGKILKKDVEARIPTIHVSNHPCGRWTKCAESEYHIIITPSAYKYTQEHGINVWEVIGSGQNGRITYKDVVV